MAANLHSAHHRHGLLQKTEVVGDLADMAAGVHDRDVDLGVAIIRRNLEQGRVLARQRGDGPVLCKGCDKSIPQARLDAVPWADRCRDCQEKVENKSRRS